MYETLEKKGEKGVSLTISINDETNQYGQNLSGWVSQTKEDREAKKPRFFVGNGKCFWTDGKITKAEQQQSNVVDAEVVEEEDDDLPF